MLPFQMLDQNVAYRQNTFLIAVEKENVIYSAVTVTEAVISNVTKPIVQDSCNTVWTGLKRQVVNGRNQSVLSFQDSCNTLWTRSKIQVVNGRNQLVLSFQDSCNTLWTRSKIQVS